MILKNINGILKTDIKFCFIIGYNQVLSQKEFNLSNFSTVRSVIISLFKPELLEIASAVPAKDPKTRLQELLQGEGFTPPAYRVSQTLGQAHRREFIVECEIPERGLLTHGRGSSRKAAEQKAATLGIEKLLKEKSKDD